MLVGKLLNHKIKFVSAFVIVALVAVGLLFVAAPLLAQEQNLELLRTSAGAGDTGLITLIGRIIQVVLGLLGVVAVILLIYAGFYWMTASGDPAKITKAKKIIIGTIIGLVIIFMSFAIVSFIMSRFGGGPGGPGAPCDVEGEIESCLTSDACLGQRVCQNGRWSGCVKDDPGCPIDPFYNKQFTYLSGVSDPAFSGWTRFSNLSRGFSGTLQLPSSETLLVSGYAHDRDNPFDIMQLSPEGAADIDFNNDTSEVKPVNGQLHNVVSQATTTWDASGYAVGATTTVFIKVFNAINEQFDSKKLEAKFWPAHCFNGEKDEDETDIDCGGSCPNCDGASCQRPDNPVCDDDNCASGICLLDGCTCATTPRIDYISPASDPNNDTDFDTPSTTVDDLANGAPGSFITIWGRRFGTAPGRVIFRDPVSGVQHQALMYLGTNCTGTWSNNQIITKVPEALTGGETEKNLLGNSGFESDFSAADWYLAAKGSGAFVPAPGVDYLSITSTAEGVSPRSGGKMLRFDAFETGEYIVLRYQNPIILEEGKKYVFSGYAYVPDQGNLNRVFLDLWDNGRHVTNGLNQIDICQANPGNLGCDNSNTPTATGTWQRMQRTFTVLPGGSLEFYPRIVFASSSLTGFIYFDDFQLEEIPASANNPTSYNPKEFQLGNYTVEVVNTSTELTSNLWPFEVNDIERPGICNMIPSKGVHPSTTQIYGIKFPTAAPQNVLWQVYNRYYELSQVGVNSTINVTSVKEIITSTYAIGWTQFSVTDTPPLNKRGRSGVRVYNGTEYSNYFNFLISSGGLGDVCGYSNLACDDDVSTCIAGLACQYCQSSNPSLDNYQANCDYSKNCTCQAPGVVCVPGTVSTTPSAKPAGEKVTCTPPFAGANCTGFLTCNPAGNGYVCAADPTDEDCPGYATGKNASQSVYAYAFTAVRNGDEGASCGYDAWGACDINGCDSGFVCDVSGGAERQWIELYDPTIHPISLPSLSIEVYDLERNTLDRVINFKAGFMSSGTFMVINKDANGIIENADVLPASDRFLPAKGRIVLKYINAQFQPTVVDTIEYGTVAPYAINSKSYGRPIDGTSSPFVILDPTSQGNHNSSSPPYLDIGTSIGRVVINEVYVGTPPCTCVQGQACKPGQTDKSCPSLGACAQIKACNSNGYWGSCGLADPNCIPYPFYGNPAQSIFAWAFTANLANATDEPYVIESCNRDTDCVGQPLGSPSPWYEGDTYQENGEYVGWTSTTNSYVKNPKACLDSVITARFNVKMFEDSFTNRVLVYRCDDRECTINPEQYASTVFSVDRDNNSLEDDILNIRLVDPDTGEGLLTENKWYKVILLKGIVSDFNKPLKVDADKIAGRHCAVSGFVDVEDIAYCWNFQTRSETLATLTINVAEGSVSDEIILPNIGIDVPIVDIFDGQLTGDDYQTNPDILWVWNGSFYSATFQNATTRTWNGAIETISTGDKIKIEVKSGNGNKTVSIPYRGDDNPYCNIGCVECQPNPSTAWWYAYQTAHRATPVADDNVCIALDGENYEWEWSEKEYGGPTPNPSDADISDNSNWPSSGPYATVMDVITRTSTSTALQETSFNDPNFVRISATERESQRMGYCRLKNDFTNPIVVEDRSCTKGTTQSPSPYKATTDACINAMVSARFSRNMVNSSIFSDADNSNYIGTNSDTIIIQKCDSETDVTSTAYNANGHCDDISISGGYIFPYSYTNMTLEQMSAASTTVTSSDPEGFVIDPNDGEEAGHTLRKNTWYRVIIRGGEQGVRGATGTAETANGLLMTPGLTYDFNFSQPSDLNGDGDWDYMWYFKTDDTDQLCPIDTVNVSPYLKFFRYVDQNSLYNAFPQAANCNILDGNAYTWVWKSLIELADDTSEAGAGSGDGIAKICTTTAASYAGCAISTRPTVKVFGAAEGLVNIKARASSTRKIGANWNNPENGDKWGSGQLQIGYGDLAIIGYAPINTVCKNPDYTLRFNMDVDVGSFDFEGSDRNIGLHLCNQGQIYYPLDGNATNTTEHSGRDAQISDVGFGSGKFGQAAIFDGVSTSSYIAYNGNDIASEASGIAADDTLTVSAWVKMDSVSENGRVIASMYHYNNGTSQYGWLLGKEWHVTGQEDGSGRGAIFFKVRDGSGGHEARAAYNNFFFEYGGKWTHVVGVFKAKEGGVPGYIKLFINGKEVSSADTELQNIVFNTNVDFNNLYLGRRMDNEHGSWDGAIDDFHLYYRAFTATEVRKLYESKPGDCPFNYYQSAIELRPYFIYTAQYAKYSRQMVMTTTAPLTPGLDYRVIVKGGSNGIKSWSGKPLSGLNYKAAFNNPAGEECETSTYPWNTTLVNSQNVCSSSLNCILDPDINLCDTIYSQCTTSTIGADYCSDRCQNLGNRKLNSCGDGILGPQEDCDDGNIKDDDGCSSHCLLEGASDRWGAVCGNAILETGEQCDDGGTTLTNASYPICNNKCLIETAAGVVFHEAGSDPDTPICGNGIVEKGEDCDDANIESDDGCRGTETQNGCVLEGSKNLAVCGDGVVETGQYDSFSWAFKAGEQNCGVPIVEINPCINGIWRFKFDQEAVSSTITIYRKMDNGDFTGPGSCVSIALKDKPANFFVAAINKIRDVVLKFLGIRKATAALSWCPISTITYSQADINAMKEGFYNDKNKTVYTDGVSSNSMEIIGYTDEGNQAVVNYINSDDWDAGVEYRAKVLVQDESGITRSAENSVKTFGNICQLKNVIADIWPRGETKDHDTFFCAGNDCGKDTADNDKNTHSDEYDDDMSAVWTETNSYYDLPNTASDYLGSNQHVYRLWAVGINDYLLKSSFNSQTYDYDGVGVLRADLSVRSVSTDYTGDFWVTGGNKNGEAALLVTSTAAGAGEVTSTIMIRTFLCKNPWPSWQYFPYQDMSTTNCRAGTGTCFNTNFLTYYCRDAGDASTTADDLPALPTSTSGVLIRGGNSTFGDCANLPDDFVPRLGYYDHFQSKSVLWSNEGEVYAYDGTDYWEKIPKGTEAIRGLPNDFRPVTGYYHEEVFSQINLWDASGNLYVGKEGACDEGVCIIWRKYNTGDSSLGMTITGLPANFAPTAGYYVTAGAAIYLWSGRSLYQGTNISATTINFTPVSHNLPENVYPIIGYYNNVANAQVIWSASGVRYSSTNGGSTWTLDSPAGLPADFRPTVSYYDRLNEKAVVWTGQRAFSSHHSAPFQPEYYYTNNCDINIKDFFFSTQSNNGGNIGLGIKVVSNGNHYSPLYWYKIKFPQERQGNPRAIETNGYQGILEGRTAYFSAVNKDSANIYTDMYIMSYDQDVGTEAGNIFAQMVDNWQFNTSLIPTDTGGVCTDFVTPINTNYHCITDESCQRFSTSTRYFCGSDRAKLARDARRLSDIQDINALLVNYYDQSRCSNDFLRLCDNSDQCYGGGICGNFYPSLRSGTYLIGKSYSVWPSWLSNLGNSLGTALPVDPVNKFIGCSGGYNQTTCWNEQNKSMSCPTDAFAYQYVDLNNAMTRLSIKSEYYVDLNSTINWKPAWDKVNFLRANPFRYYYTSTMCQNLPVCDDGSCDINFGENISNCSLDCVGGETEDIELPFVDRCGNGVVQTGEECDGGSLCSDCQCVAGATGTGSVGCECITGFVQSGNACVCAEGYTCSGETATCDEGNDCVNQVCATNAYGTFPNCTICPPNAVCDGGTTGDCAANSYGTFPNCTICPPNAVCDGTTDFVCDLGFIPTATACNPCSLGSVCNCPAGQTWAGTACCASGSTSCSSCSYPSYWNGSSCISCAGAGWNCATTPAPACPGTNCNSTYGTFSLTKTPPDVACDVFRSAPPSCTAPSRTCNPAGVCCPGEGWNDDTACPGKVGDSFTLWVGGASGDKPVSYWDPSLCSGCLGINHGNNLTFTIESITGDLINLTTNYGNVTNFSDFMRIRADDGKFSGYYFVGSGGNIYKNISYPIRIKWDGTFKWVDPDYSGDGYIKDGGSESSFIVK